MEALIDKPSLLSTLKAVLAGAVGIRRRVEDERAPLKPVQLIVAAVIFLVLFIFTLLAVVKIVLSQA